jgi:hypothetical protein
MNAIAAFRCRALSPERSSVTNDFTHSSNSGPEASTFFAGISVAGDCVEVLLQAGTSKTLVISNPALTDADMFELLVSVIGD